MGAEVCRTVASDPGMELVAAIDPRDGGSSLPDIAGPDAKIEASADISALKDAGAVVAVDFTTPSSVIGNIEWCLENGVHCVVGTTGISDGDLQRLTALAEGAGSNVLIAPNFAIGAVLMMRFAGMAAKWFSHAEIVELHHEGKLDSPSGTSIRTAEAIGKGRSGKEEPPSGDGSARSGSMPEARGAQKHGVRIHSVRLPGLVAHQEVIFGGQGQTLSIRHDSIDRSSFMPGVLLAIREVSNLPGVTLGLESLLDG